jgi:iron complex outermembrane receptor protein
MNDKLRLIASGRLDKFNYPDKLYTPYQLAATYKINDDNLLRISGGTAYRTPLLIDLFTNLDLTGPFPVTSPTQTYLFELEGNKNIRLLSTSMVSLGYRHKMDSKLELDIEGYYSMTKNFSDLISGADKIDSTAPVAFTGLIEITNLTVRLQLFGSTISLNYYTGKWQFRPYITIQQSYLLDYSPYANTPQSFPSPSNNNNPALYNLYSNSGTRIDNKAAPAYFGGAYINYEASDNLNINVNGYFYAAQTELESDNLTYKDGQRGVQNMNPKLILNAVIGYNLTRKLNIFANFQNCLNDKSVEFYKGDATAFMAFVGFHFAF